jgi:hypothetical protein
VVYNLAVEANTKHLLKSWAVVVSLCVLVLVGMVFGTIAALRRGEYIPVFAVTVGLVIATVNILRARRKALFLFRNPTPDRAIAFYHSSMKRIPNGKAMAAYQSAFAAVIYGQFDRAREELASVNWASLPPLYQGFETYIHSLLAIFESKDYSRALRLAEEARDLCDVPDEFPGAGKSRRALDANVAVCELLVGKDGPDLLGRVDRATKELPGVSPAIPAWALAVYHANAGRAAAAEGYLKVVKRLLPPASPLNDLSVDAREMY